MSEGYDILIENAVIVDGTGSDAFRGNFAVKDEKIVAINEEVKGDAKTVIDACGMVVTPGFIDVHNHADLSILYYPEAESFIRQGITTFIGGNCGDSPGPYGDYIGEPWFLTDIWDDVAPYMYYRDWILPRDLVNSRHKEIYGWEIDWHTMGEFCKRVEAKGLSPNYVPIVGHGDIRSLVMGPDFKRTATREEVADMQEQVRQAMEDGCCGLSVGRDYEPGFYADLEELVACAEVVAQYGGVYTSHCLYRGPSRVLKPGEIPPPRIKGILEAIEVGRRGNIPVEISHLSPMYEVRPSNDVITQASIKATLQVIDDAIEEGIDVNFDIIPNHLTGGIFTTSWLIRLLIPWLRLSGSPEKFAEALRMKEFRSEIKEAIYKGKWFRLNPIINPNWVSLLTVVVCKDKRFVDKTVAQSAKELGVDPLDALMEILAADPYTKAVRRGDDDSGKLMFYRHPASMIGVDTFAIDDKYECRHPPWFMPNENSYGGFPRYFRRTVRETKTLTLEEAVHKVTALPARKFMLKDRGVLKVGAYADIVMMNPKTLSDRGDQLNPRRYPKGIEHVIINGVSVVEKEEHTGARPGKILYRG